MPPSNRPQVIEPSDEVRRAYESRAAQLRRDIAGFAKMVDTRGDPKLGERAWEKEQEAREALRVLNTPKVELKEMGGLYKKVVTHPNGRVEMSDATPGDVRYGVEQKLLADPTRAAQAFEKEAAKRGLTPGSQEYYALEQQYLPSVKRERINVDIHGSRYPAAPEGKDYLRDAFGRVRISPETGTPTLLNIPGGAQDVTSREPALSPGQVLSRNADGTPALDDQGRPQIINVPGGALDVTQRTPPLKPGQAYAKDADGNIAYNKDGMPRAVNIPGGEQDVAARAASETAQITISEIQSKTAKITGLIDAVINHAGLPSISDRFNQFRPSWSLSRDGRDALARFEQLEGTAFLEGRLLLKGGGAITDFESNKATAAEARLKRSTDPDDLRAALGEWKYWVKEGAKKLEAHERVKVLQGEPSGGKPWTNVPGAGRFRRID